MKDDLLREASSALRDETAEADDGARFTRARVMASLQQGQVRRRARIAVLLPLAACFAAATAWGTVSGRVPALFQSVRETFGFGVEAPPETRPRESAAPRSARPRAAEPGKPVAPAPPPPAPAPPVPEPAELVPTAPPTAAPQDPPTRVTPPAPVPPRSSAARTRSDAAGTAAPAASLAPSDPAHELYRDAHRLHFAGQAFAPALRAWDAYLEAAPNGRFALEARYNRALCLVRLGRAAEARRALQPFADGGFGSYRREEARALLDALPAP